MKYDMELIRIRAFFEQKTKALVKDVFEDKLDKLTFVVNQGQIRKALGQKLANLKLIEGKLKKKIRIIEFHPHLEEFIRNVIHPLKANTIQVEGEGDETIVTIIPADHNTRGLLIGRNASHLRNTEATIQRFFPLKEMKVI